MTEWRKHASQMTKYELRRLYQLINNNQFSYTDYSKDRLQTRKIKDSRVQNVIKFGCIIEFHYKNGDYRVLLRSVERANSQSICVVVNLTEKQIITVYQNEITDNHDTLHNEIYDNRIDIMKYIKVS